METRYFQMASPCFTSGRAHSVQWRSSGPPRFVVSPTEIRDGRGVKWKARSVKFVSLSKIGMYIPLEHTQNMSISSGNMHIN